MQIISHAIEVFDRLTYEVLNKDVELESGEASVSPLRRQEKGECDGGQVYESQGKDTHVDSLSQTQFTEDCCAQNVARHAQYKQQRYQPNRDEANYPRSNLFNKIDER